MPQSKPESLKQVSSRIDGMMRGFAWAVKLNNFDGVVQKHTKSLGSWPKLDSGELAQLNGIKQVFMEKLVNAWPVAFDK